MAANVTLLEMMTRVRELTGQETATPTNHFISRDFLVRSLNNHIRRLWDKLIERTPEYYEKDASSIPIVAGTKSYALPADFYRVLVVHATDGSSWHELPRFELVEDLVRLRWLELNGSSTIHDYCYRLRAANIQILPTPATSGHTLEMAYLPAATLLSADGDTFDGINGWEFFAIYGTCIDVAGRDEMDPSSFVFQRKAIEEQIDRLAGSRDEARPARVVKTRGRRPGYLRGGWTLPTGN